VAEARSHDEGKLADVVQEMLETVTFAATLAECEVETHVEGSARGYRFRRDDLPVRIAAAALEKIRSRAELHPLRRWADANVFTSGGCSASTSRTG